MKLDDIKALVRAGCTPEVQRFLITYFEENPLPEEEQLRLLDGLQKGDDVSRTILEIHLQAFFLEGPCQLRLIELFEQKVKGAEEILMMSVQRGLCLNSRRKLLELFKKRVKGSHKLLKTLIESQSKHTFSLFCENDELELINCLEKGIFGSQTLLKAYIEKSSLCDSAQIALAELFRKGVKGAREFLAFYVTKYAPKYQVSKDLAVILVACFKEGIDGAKEILLTYAEKLGLPKDAQEGVVDCFREGLDGAKEILMSIIQDACGENHCYSEEVELTLLDCFRAGVDGASEILEKQFPVPIHRLHAASEKKLVKFVIDGKPGAKELLLKYTAHNDLWYSIDTLLSWIKEGGSERKEAVLRHIPTDYPHGLPWKAERELVACFRQGIPGAEDALKAYMSIKHYLDEDSEEELVYAFNEGVENAKDILLKYIKEQAIGLNESHRKRILNALQEDINGAETIRNTFDTVRYFYYEL